MCGIVGYIGKKNAAEIIMGGLKHLEYRGYDSAGMAICAPAEDGHSGRVVVKRAVGKLSALRDKIGANLILGSSGIGHTRWATHGEPNLCNAHPHRYGRVSLVHNGILENHRSIREKLLSRGHSFVSDTDTEVAAHLLEDFLADGLSTIDAIGKLVDLMQGTYAFGIIIEGEPGRLYFAKNASPLIIAQGDGECFFASDQSALVDHGPQYLALEDFDKGYITADELCVFDSKGQAKEVFLSPLTAKKESVQKLGHKHFMHKEIFEQPSTVARVLAGRVNHQDLDFLGFGIDFEKILAADKIEIIACGSSYFAGLLAKQKLESTLRVPVLVEIASEYRYRDTLTDNRTFVIAISQSGETIDTLAALKKASSLGAACMSVCNVLGSAIARECEKSAGNLFLNAGPEISVACTKAFVAQLVALRILTAAIAKKKGLIDGSGVDSLFHDFANLRQQMKKILDRDQEIRAIAKTLIDEPRMLFLGRGDFFAVALEGALKMKELSYIFAEGYPAGELKHGPIATVDPGMPAIIVCGSDELSKKTESNTQEIKARKAKIIAFSPSEKAFSKDNADIYFSYGECAPELETILATIPLQLLAYHIADLKGLDVDQPRNLAKSVTVE